MVLTKFIQINKTIIDPKLAYAFVKLTTSVTNHANPTEEIKKKSVAKLAPAEKIFHPFLLMSPALYNMETVE